MLKTIAVLYDPLNMPTEEYTGHGPTISTIFNLSIGFLYVAPPSIITQMLDV